MNNSREIELGELMPKEGRSSINPADYPSEAFELLSIPAYDRNSPEIALGGEIGSTKQVVQPGDVLLSKIVPHIRRAWVVEKSAGSRQIASSEWIVFSNNEADARYLRHFLLSDGFHRQFMQTVSGVGGSLLRARPKYVAKIKIPLPPLEEQQRIAVILDRAQDIKGKAAQRADLLSALGRSLFMRRFGLPSENPYELPLYRLVEICNPKQWPTISSKQLKDSGYPVFGANGLIGYFDRFNHPHPTVLVTCRGATCGTVNISPPDCYVTGNSMAMDDPDYRLITTEYLAWVLRLRGMHDVISGSAQPQITRQGLEAVTIPVPSIEEQGSFSNELRAVKRVDNSSRLSERSISEVANCLAAQLSGDGRA
ncbi:restriction endonuclease subunit S [Synechococcus sp. L2F]|uniref:restriction endonuclease subunit S n=1 Tax=Synechococcus sp. L2F TaxID=2823739 RepID=UPI0020CEFB74|nr:restriction endonuclease subunit S [Synechococcus sp. L2F]MCP9829317.1 restriction endonuclease subunit S [Synechococcus sp. L2F]